MTKHLPRTGETGSKPGEHALIHMHVYTESEQFGCVIPEFSHISLVTYIHINK